jgi:hypothetical protein
LHHHHLPGPFERLKDDYGGAVHFGGYTGKVGAATADLQDFFLSQFAHLNPSIDLRMWSTELPPGPTAIRLGHAFGFKAI